jgi:hypothetical protein
MVRVRTRDGAAVAAQRLAGYLVDASEQKAPLAALTLPLAAGANVDVRARVDGSDDLATWRPLGRAPLLALEYAGRRLARERVELAGAPAKYLRITFEPGRAVPSLTVVRGEFADRVVEAPLQWREVDGTADPEHPGDYTFDLRGAFPVERIALGLPEQNTVAPAQVFARASAKDEWRLAGTAVFYRLQRDGAEAVNPPLAVPATTLRYWKVSTDPKSGGLGSRPPKLAAGWSPQSIVFVARGGGPFELAYGSAQAKPAALPIATIVPGFDARATPATLPVATVGAANVTPALAALRAPIDVKRGLLWATLGVATLVLGWMALRLARGMSDKPSQPPPASPPDG